MRSALGIPLACVRLLDLVNGRTPFVASVPRSDVSPVGSRRPPYCKPDKSACVHASLVPSTRRSNWRWTAVTSTSRFDAFEQLLAFVPRASPRYDLLIAAR